MKLALGTVQFGLSYGIANDGGQVGQHEVMRILALARRSGVDILDTASAYGESETCLGAVGISGFRVVTKLPATMEANEEPESWAVRHLRSSLRDLHIDTVYGLLLHRSEQLLGPAGRSLAKTLMKFKADGLVNKIGVSIYDPNELDAVTQICAIDLVQAPFNLVDRRLMASGWLHRLHDLGIEVHTRSAFLQGLLLMPRHRVPERFSQWSWLFDQWHAWLTKNRQAALDTCLNFVNHPAIDRVVIGVDSYVQLDEILQVIARLSIAQVPDLSCSDERLINPSNWKSL